eukprot:PhF_6_TR26176/c0_g2_i1/m.37193
MLQMWIFYFLSAVSVSSQGSVSIPLAQLCVALTSSNDTSHLTINEIDTTTFRSCTISRSITLECDPLSLPILCERHNPCFRVTSFSQDISVNVVIIGCKFRGPTVEGNSESTNLRCSLSLQRVFIEGYGDDIDEEYADDGVRLRSSSLVNVSYLNNVELRDSTFVNGYQALYLSHSNSVTLINVYVRNFTCWDIDNHPVQLDCVLLTTIISSTFMDSQFLFSSPTTYGGCVRLSGVHYSSMRNVTFRNCVSNSNGGCLGVNLNRYGEMFAEDIFMENCKSQKGGGGFYAYADPFTTHVMRNVQMRGVFSGKPVDYFFVSLSGGKSSFTVIDSYALGGSGSGCFAVQNLCNELCRGKENNSFVVFKNTTLMACKKLLNRSPTIFRHAQMILDENTPTAIDGIMKNITITHTATRPAPPAPTRLNPTPNPVKPNQSSVNTTTKTSTKTEASETYLSVVAKSLTVMAAITSPDLIISMQTTEMFLTFECKNMLLVSGDREDKRPWFSFARVVLPSKVDNTTTSATYLGTLSYDSTEAIMAIVTIVVVYFTHTLVVTFTSLVILFRTSNILTFTEIFFKWRSKLRYPQISVHYHVSMLIPVVLCASGSQNISTIVIGSTCVFVVIAAMICLHTYSVFVLGCTYEEKDVLGLEEKSLVSKWIAAKGTWEPRSAASVGGTFFQSYRDRIHIGRVEIRAHMCIWSPVVLGVVTAVLSEVSVQTFTTSQCNGIILTLSCIMILFGIIHFATNSMTIQLMNVLRGSRMICGGVFGILVVTTGSSVTNTDPIIPHASLVVVIVSVLEVVVSFGIKVRAKWNKRQTKKTLEQTCDSLPSPKGSTGVAWEELSPRHLELGLNP